MKLIDILVRDLPKHGGWPDGFSGLVQMNNGIVVNEYQESNPFRAEAICYGRKFEMASDEAAVSREQYEAALAASKLEWDGVGMPPVGCECEAMISNPMGVGRDWRKVKVVHTGSPGSKSEALVFDVETTYPSWADEFRPIRSEADKRRDSVLLAMNIAANEGESGICSGLVAIYDAIAAGKIPGVKLED